MRAEEQPDLPTDLTAEECETLAGIAFSSPELAERERELNRLRFARWLVEQGIVNELLEEEDEQM